MLQYYAGRSSIMSCNILGTISEYNIIANILQKPVYITRQFKLIIPSTQYPILTILIKAWNVTYKTCRIVGPV